MAERSVKRKKAARTNDVFPTTQIISFPSKHQVKPYVDSYELIRAKLGGVPGRIRTFDPQLRRLMLYPTELPGLGVVLL